MAAPFQPLPRGALVDQWGRSVDRSWSFENWPPQGDPDTTTTDQYFDISTCPQIVAGMVYSDISNLFVSAKGIDDKKSGAYFPAQLIYTSPQISDQEILDVTAWQFDEALDGGFPQIIRSLDNPAKSYGRCIAEIEWEQRKVQPYKGKVFARMVYSRDPERYVFDYEGNPGLWRNDGFGIYKKMDARRFFSYTYNPLFNNPYGSSINLPLKPWVETFNKIFGYWRHALEKAGLGSWTATYPNAWTGNGTEAVKNREKLLEQVGNLAAGTKGIFPEGANITAQKLQMEAQAFLDWYASFCEIVSLIHTGTTTALKEGEFGSKSAKESTDVREKARLEQLNAMRVSNAWTYRFIPLFCRFNFRPSRLKGFPTLQLIAPNLITPTTPGDQITAKESVQKEDTDQEVIDVKTKTAPEPDDEQLRSENAEMMGKNHPWLKIDPEITKGVQQKIIDNFLKDGAGIQELQDEETPEPVTPVAIPAGYQHFPDDSPLPDSYKDSLDFARDALQEMQVKEFEKVQPGDVSNVFTVKRLRNYTTDVMPILQGLKTAIDITLDAPTEKQAWEEYYQLASTIFASNGIPMDPGIRNDLNISFRQARQNVLNEGLYRSIIDDPAVVALRLKPNPNVSEHHLDEIAWNNLVIDKTHPELQRGGRLRIPLNFGCLHTYEKVYNLAEITPESEWPVDFPGETYKYYAQPDTREPEAQA